MDAIVSFGLNTSLFLIRLSQMQGFAIVKYKMYDAIYDFIYRLNIFSGFELQPEDYTVPRQGCWSCQNSIKFILLID